MATKPDLRSAMRAGARGASLDVTEAAGPSTAAVSSPSSSRDPHYRPGRSRKTNITGFFAPAVKRQLRLMAAEQDRTIQDLLAEGINFLFAAHGKAEIAERENTRERKQ